MIRNSETYKRLQKLKPFVLTKEHLSTQGAFKVKDTIKYSLTKDPTQDRSEVAKRCLIAILAEQYVSEQVFGFMPSGDEDYQNAFSFAYDVVAKDGVRIEVKTHQAKSKWINVTTGNTGYYPTQTQGINLGPLLDHKLADLIIIFDAYEETPCRYLFTPKVLAGRLAFEPETGLVQKSKYESGGFYLKTCDPEKYPYWQFTS